MIVQLQVAEIAARLDAILGEFRQRLTMVQSPDEKIFWACKTGNLDAVKDAYATSHHEDAHGWHPIHYACSHGHLAVVQWLAQMQGVAPDLQIRKYLPWDAVTMQYTPPS